MTFTGRNCQPSESRGIDDAGFPRLQGRRSWTTCCSRTPDRRRRRCAWPTTGSPATTVPPSSRPASSKSHEHPPGSAASAALLRSPSGLPGRLRPAIRDADLDAAGVPPRVPGRPIQPRLHNPPATLRGCGKSTATAAVKPNSHSTAIGRLGCKAVTPKTDARPPDASLPTTSPRIASTTSPSTTPTTERCPASMAAGPSIPKSRTPARPTCMPASISCSGTPRRIAPRNWKPG